jgi:Kdo2-lipid IVA lauroyltransferase/acyltransferase
MNKALHFLTFLLIRTLTAPALLFSYSALHAFGKPLGLVAYHLMTQFRKRALSNLALATSLALSEEEIIRFAKESFQNLVITCLEYPKLWREKQISRIVKCVNPEEAEQIRQSGKSLIFFCGHLANWELLFLEGTSRMPGVAIGRPVKNSLLYDWVLSIRQKFGGKIIPPKNAIKEGLRALKQGLFLGIVGDQGMPDSGYSSPFFGRRAWTSPFPALLAQRTGSPIIVASTRRLCGTYQIHYSAPIWPEADAPNDIDRMMRAALALLEEEIKKAPGQWLWQHNRWKQQVPGKLKKRFRHESILVILPEEEEWLPHLATLRAIYPLEFITLLIPEILKGRLHLSEAEILTYATPEQLLLRDYRFKLVFNFSGSSNVRSHFLKLSAFEVVTLCDLKKIAKATPSDTLSQILKKSLCHAL